MIMSFDEKVKVNAYILHSKPHIEVNSEKCRSCSTKPCVKLCPAGCYRLSPSGEVMFSHDACLECGTCRLVCPHRAVRWSYPEAGYGIWYRFG